LGSHWPAPVRESDGGIPALESELDARKIGEQFDLLRLTFLDEVPQHVIAQQIGRDPSRVSQLVSAELSKARRMFAA
jgi:hypothetical protein